MVQHCWPISEHIAPHYFYVMFHQNFLFDECWAEVCFNQTFSQHFVGCNNVGMFCQLSNIVVISTVSLQSGLSKWLRLLMKSKPYRNSNGKMKKKLETNSKLWRAILFSRWRAVHQTNVGQICWLDVLMYQLKNWY